jgi:prepilin-type N-terminal cleavage/methylation domain-containing protein
MRIKRAAFSLTELLVVIAIALVLGSVALTAGWKAYQNSSLAISASNIRQLSIGSAAYLADHNQIFFPYRATDPSAPNGTTWWFGFESATSAGLPEGERILQPNEGPLAGYVPAGIRPDPSLRLGGKSFKPKYKFGYIGVGYNVLLGGGWTGTTTRLNALQLPKPGQIVVFSTSAQVNNFQSPASASNPMLEEFYGIDQREVTVHFRHAGNAMVAFANGSAGFLPMDPSTLDTRAPKANVGRFAPKNSTKYLLPDPAQ